MEDDDLIATYIYNADGHRTRKTVTQDGKSTTTIYHYDHMGYLLEETTNTGQLIKSYIRQESRYLLAQIDHLAGGEVITYVYNDQKYATTMRTNPGRRLRIRVNVIPAP